MASVTKEPSGHFRIRFSYSGKRHSITLATPEASAREFWRRVEELILCRASNRSWSRDLTDWLGSLAHEHYHRLSAIGLVPPRPRRTRHNEAVRVLVRGEQLSVSLSDAQKTAHCSCRGSNPSCFRCGGTGIAPPQTKRGRVSTSRRRANARTTTGLAFQSRACPACGLIMRSELLKNHMKLAHGKKG